MNIIKYNKNFCLSSDSKCTLKTNPCFRELLKQKYISDNFYNKFNVIFCYLSPANSIRDSKSTTDYSKQS